MYVIYLQNISNVENEGIWEGLDRNPFPILLYLETFHFVDLQEYSETYSIRMRSKANNLIRLRTWRVLIHPHRLKPISKELFYFLCLYL
jgi:hypothetical protein